MHNPYDNYDVRRFLQISHETREPTALSFRAARYGSCMMTARADGLSAHDAGGYKAERRTGTCLTLRLIQKQYTRRGGRGDSPLGAGGEKHLGADALN